MTADNGSVHFWDWNSGYDFQQLEVPSFCCRVCFRGRVFHGISANLQTIVQPGSLESEAGIYCVQFDRTGSRLLTAEADKTIKVYKEDENAVSYLAIVDVELLQLVALTVPRYLCCCVRQTPETHPINFNPSKRKRF